ncbi:MAG: PaaI family thioesterase [Solirubrobacterales bacterium]
MAERTKHSVTAETVRELIAGSFPGDLGIEPISIEDDKTVGRIAVDKRHLHPGGLVHGGVWTALADTVAAWATFRNIPAGHDFTTVELKLNVFTAGRVGDELIAEARPLHVGRSTVALIVEIRKAAEPDRLAAAFTLTQFVLPPRS